MSEVQTLHALSRNTVSLIGSCQVITSVYSVVKELVENSLDAGASSVDVKLEDFGLEKIEVSDNGKGIKTVDVPYMAKRHFTSKISSSEDLNFLTTYGFRGEALGSLCAVSKMTITTKTAEDPLSCVYTIGPDGDIVDKKPSHNGKGTVVSSKNLFHNIPVRKQYYNGSQRKKEDLKRIEHLLMIYAIVKPDLRLTLKHGKDLVLQKTALKDVKTALHSVLGRQVANQLLHKEKCSEELKMNISAFLPKPGSDVKDMSLASADKTFIAVNKRPVIVSELNKVLKSYYSNCHGLDSYRHPVCFVSLDVATNQVDVNVDPNKTKVFFQQKADIITALEEILVEIYGPLENVPSWHYREPDDENKTHKETDVAPSNEVKNSVRPFISYSKRPGDDETTGSESNDKNVNDVSDKDIHTTKSHSSLPSFSLTFHSKLSDQIMPNSNSKTKDNSVNLDSNIETQSLPESLEDKNKSLSENKNPLSVNSNSIQILVKDNGAMQGSDTDISKEDDIIETASVSEIASDLGNENCAMQGSEIDILKEGNIIETALTNNFTSVLDSRNRKSLSPTPGNDVISLVQEVTVLDDLVNDSEKSNGKSSPHSNGKDCDNQVSVSNIDSSDWSRGNVTVGNTTLQPVKLLPPSSSHRPGKRPSSPFKALESSQPKRKVAKLNILSNQTTLFDMMNSQKVQKPESPFTHFYQEKCPALSQEYPNEDTTVLKERLKGEWEKMTDDDRVSYREKCWHDTKRYERDKVSIIKQSNGKISQGAESNSVKTTEKMKKILKKRLYCKESSIKIPMNKIRNPNQQELSSTKESEPKVVGPAHQSDDVWICTLHDKLYLVNAWRLAEVSLYRKLKDEHRLPIHPCDPVVLDSRAITDQGVSTLESLAKHSQGNGTYFHIPDERLIANGFDIKCHHDSNGNLVCEMVGVCNVIPAYGLKDLNVILGVIRSNEDASLSKTRTLKAAYYLQS